MSFRDELAALIVKHRGAFFGLECSEPAAYDIHLANELIATGWTKPRRITEHYGDDGVEGLSNGAVILSGVTTSVAQSDGTWLDSWGSTYDFYELNLPATVLWEPQS